MLGSSVAGILEVMHIQRATVGVAAVVFLAASVGACGSSSSNPTTPTPPSPTLTSVTVATASPGAMVFQLVATAHFSDSTTRDVTSAAQWQSSSLSVATVAPTGMVTVVGTGDVELRATYQTVTGKLGMHVVVAPRPTVTLSGVAREVEPNKHTLAGVRIGVVSGADAGKFVVTDGSGNYRFTGLTQGPISVTATMTGYETWQAANLTLTADRQEDAWLVPVPPKDGSGATATARCKDRTWSWSTDAATVCAANGGVAYPVCPGPFCPNARVQ
jgi:hypothetical protein